MTSAWATIATTETTNLEDVFSEDLARKLHSFEVGKFREHQKIRENKQINRESIVQNKWDDESDDSMEEVDWNQYESILVKFDPRPNYIKDIPQRKAIIRFDFEESGLHLMDNYTRVVLYNLLKSGVLSAVKGVLFEGKEALLLHGFTGKGERCVIKIFKKAYAHSEEKARLCQVETRRPLTFYAQQEMLNLQKLAKLGVPCPKVIHYERHIVVMSFIGADDVAAKTLAESNLTPEQYELAFQQITDCMTKSYLKYHICHGDLNENNILWHQNTCYFIDLSQSVTPADPNAFNHFMTGAKLIYNFFKDKGVPNILTPEELFRTAVGFDFMDRYELCKIYKSYGHKLE